MKQPMEEFTLSVLMPNFNHARFLRHSLEALFQQSYTPLEIIVIDDASTDNSVEVLESLMSRNGHIRLIRNEVNLGVVANINLLLNMAAGDYVYFPAADDKVLPGFFEKSMNLLRQYPEAGLCSSMSRAMDETGADLGLLWMPFVTDKACFLPPLKCRELLVKYRYGCWYRGNTTVYRRQALIEAGGYHTELRSFCDGFISQVIALKHGACFIPEALAAYRLHETNYSRVTFTDSEAAGNVIEEFRRLSLGRYRDVMPVEHVELLQREMLFGWAVRCLSDLKRDQETFMKELNLIRRDCGLLSRVAGSLVGLLLKTEFPVMKILLRLWAYGWLMPRALVSSLRRRICHTVRV